MKQIKYWRFLIILAITGICFYNREQIVIRLTELGRPEHVETGAPAQNESSPETDVNTEEGKEENTEDSEPVAPDASTPETVPEETAEVLQPVWGAVGEEYFDDAVFIGDSRTVGLHDYAGLTNTTFYASTGLTVYKMFSARIVPTEDGSKITIEEALSGRQFQKIYLMIGINEMGTGTVETFIEKYKEVLTHLQELQPDAIIYVQAIMKVSTKRSEKGDYITNEGIEARNAEIAKLADNEKIFYLDVNPLVTDENGGLVDGYTFDGVHLLGKYVAIWKQFLLDNAITFQ